MRTKETLKQIQNVFFTTMIGHTFELENKQRLYVTYSGTGIMSIVQIPECPQNAMEEHGRDAILNTDLDSITVVRRVCIVRRTKWDVNRFRVRELCRMKRRSVGVMLRRKKR